jgi:hypothetical protein
MTKRNKSSRPSRALRTNPSLRLISGFDKTVHFPGKTLLPVSLTAGLTTSTFNLQVNTSSTLGNRLTSVGESFEEFKFTQMVLKLHPATDSAGAPVPYMVCYSKTIPTNPPSSFEQGYQFPVSRLISGSETVAQTMTIPPSVLLNNIRPWYVTNAIGEVQDFAQGALFVINPSVATDATFSPLIELGYMVSFRGATDPNTL